jgi:hypothetical protein
MISHGRLIAKHEPLVTLYAPLEKVSDGPGQIVGKAGNLKATETASLTPMSRALDPVPQVLVDWSELP